MLEFHIKELLETSHFDVSQIDSIGIGAPGQVDREKGILISAPNLNCANLNIKAILEREFYIPTYLGNDVGIATLGEMKFGAGVGFNNFVCIFVGTGIGSGIAENGKIRYGATGTAGEIGHIKLQMHDGPLCGCGDTGCLEAFASGPSIVAMANDYIRGGKSAKFREMAEGGAITPYIVCEAAKAGDPVAQRIFTIMGEYIGIGMASVVNLLNPEKIIVGGGVAEAGDFLLAPLKETLLKRAMKVAGSVVEVVPAELGNTAGVIGASLLIES